MDDRLDVVARRGRGSSWPCFAELLRRGSRSGRRREARLPQRQRRLLLLHGSRSSSWHGAPPFPPLPLLLLLLGGGGGWEGENSPRDSRVLGTADWGFIGGRSGLAWSSRQHGRRGSPRGWRFADGATWRASRASPHRGRGRGARVVALSHRGSGTGGRQRSR